MKAEPKYYREQAERCRRLAKRTTDPEVKETLLGAAAEYDKLAAS